MAIFDKKATEEEIRNLEKGGLKKLENDQLKDVNGGVIMNARGLMEADDYDDLTWEVLDDKNGAIIARFASRQEAEAYASSQQISTRSIGLIEAMHLRAGHYN